MLISLILTLIAIGVLLYVVETLLPIDATIKNIIRIVILLAVVFWLLSLGGLLPLPARLSALTAVRASMGG